MQRFRRSMVPGVVVPGLCAFLAACSSSSSSPQSGPSTAASKAQRTADRVAVAAGCPANPHAKLTKPSWPSAPAMTIDPSKTYTATVRTDLGSFVVTLDPAQAPMTVNNFVFLAGAHFYDCVTFHRVIPTFVDQTGDPTGTGTGTPGYSFADELPKAASPQYPLGSLAMANSGPNTNGSQFFIVTGREGETLDPNYSLFGHVTDGMNVVLAINADGTPNGVPPRVVHRILGVSVQTT